MPDDSNRVAIMYGPLVLAGDLGLENDSSKYDPLFVPVLMTENRNPTNWMKLIDGKPNTFQLQGIGKPRDIIFKPFYKTHERSYSVYFDLFNEKSWEIHQAAYQEKRGHDYEITKHLSLRQTNPLALITLKETGKCEIALPEFSV